MNRKIDAIKIKQDRGRLMLNLNLFYDKKVFLDSLYRTLCGDPLYSRVLFQKDIAYLHQKGYIELTRNILDDSNDWWKQMCILSATGKEIAEGTRTDECLEI